MSFWNSDTLRERLPDLISGYDKRNVVTGSYELGMGTEAYVTGQKEKIFLGEKGQVVIPPGQFALLLTEESVRVPLDAIGFISIKSKFKLWGLTNVSGFHVDPGFHGKLIFSAYNAGVQDIVISRGKRVFLFWLSAMDKQGEGYSGSRNGQETIPDEDMMKIRGEIPSPVVLSKRIDRLQNKVMAYTGIAGVLIGLATAIGVQLFFSKPFHPKSEDSSVNVVNLTPAAATAPATRSPQPSVFVPSATISPSSSAIPSPVISVGPSRRP